MAIYTYLKNTEFTIVNLLICSTKFISFKSNLELRWNVDYLCDLERIRLIIKCRSDQITKLELTFNSNTKM